MGKQVLGKWARVNKHPQMHHNGWMVCGHNILFSLGSCSPTNLLVIEGCKSVLLVKWFFKLQTQGSNKIRGLPNTDFCNGVGASSPKARKICVMSYKVFPQNLTSCP